MLEVIVKIFKELKCRIVSRKFIRANNKESENPDFSGELTLRTGQKETRNDERQAFFPSNDKAVSSACLAA
jgi:hypothetical protein